MNAVAHCKGAEFVDPVSQGPDLLGKIQQYRLEHCRLIVQHLPEC